MHPTEGKQAHRRPRRDSVLVARCTAELKAAVDVEAARRDLDPADILRESVRSYLESQPPTTHQIRTQEVTA
jgi:hypothetical protein